MTNMSERQSIPVITDPLPPASGEQIATYIATFDLIMAASGSLMLWADRLPGVVYALKLWASARNLSLVTVDDSGGHRRITACERDGSPFKSYLCIMMLPGTVAT